MITYWKQQNGLKPVKMYERDAWIDISAPSPDEIEMLVERFKVPDYVISDVLDPDERARTEVEGRWMLVILRIPIYNLESEIPFYTLPLGILISLHSIITICSQENEVVKDIIYSTKNRNIRLDDKINFVLQLFNSSANFYLKYLKEINRLTNDIEDELERSAKNSDLHRLLDMEKCLVLFMTSLKSNELLLNKLQRSRLINNEEINEELLDDVTVEYKQAIEICKVYSDIQSGRMDTFASVISNNLNVVMKRLTLITIMLAFPNVISGLLGMNVFNGLEESPYAFGAVVSLILVLGTVGFWYFKRNRFF